MCRKAKERSDQNEGSFIRKADLREVQGYEEKRQDHGDLRESEA